MMPPDKPTRGNVFIHPMKFDGAGSVIETDLVILSGRTMIEAIEEFFGTDTRSAGDKHDMLGTASIILDGQIVSRRVYKARWKKCEVPITG